MRLVRYGILGIVLALMFGATAQAQFRCDDITKSLNDSVKVLAKSVQPGTTVDVPIFMDNDSVITAFQMLVRFDPNFLTPVFRVDSSCVAVDSITSECIQYSVDSTFIEAPVTGRFLRIAESEDSIGNPVIDTITKFNATLFENRDSVVACNFLPQGDDFDSINPGQDVIFYLKFNLNPSMTHGTTTVVRFYESNIFIVDSSGTLPDTTFFPGCNTTQLSAAWYNPLTDTTQTVQTYPSLRAGGITADSNAVEAEQPVINSFSASPSTVGVGGSSTLSWSVTSADSIVIRNATTSTRVFGSPNATGNYSTASLSSTTQYQLTAYGGNLTASAFTTVTVSTTTGTPPTVSLNPSQASYTISPGETVSLTVNASEPDGDQVTLQALSLPNNATFGPTNPVVGLQNVSGNFSFTPDANQSGQFAITFRATDVDGQGNNSVVVNVEAPQFDKLFSTSAADKKPVGGLRGAEEIFWPINLVTTQTVYGIQFDMTYPDSIVTIDSIVASGRIPEWVVYENIIDQPGQVRVVTYGLDNEPVLTDTTTAVLYVVMTLDSNATPWVDYPILIDNGWESVDPSPEIPSLPLLTEDGIVAVDRPGDVNLDKHINVADAVNIVGNIIGNYGLNRRQFATADVIMNDSVDVFDLVGVVNLIYEIDLPGAPGAPLSGTSARLALEYGDIPGGSSGVMRVNSEIPEEVAGVQLEFAYDPATVSLGAPEPAEGADGFALSYKDDGNGSMKMILYHLAPVGSAQLIQSGISDLVEVPLIARRDVKSGNISQLRLTRGLLSTPTMQQIPLEGGPPPLPSGFTLHQNYPNPFNPTTTIEFAIGIGNSGLGAQHVKLDIFNVLGQRVTTLLDEALPTGDHSVEWNATDEGGQRVASGVYLYRLTVGEESRTKKMLFLK